LAVVIADDEAGDCLFDGAGRREAARLELGHAPGIAPASRRQARGCVSVPDAGREDEPREGI
jgi:hypothetical protein